MDPTTPSPDNNTDSTKQWFEELPSANSTPLPPPSVPSGSSKKKWFVVAGVALLIIVAAGTAVAILNPFAKTPPADIGRCLTENDYASLTGTKLDEPIVSKEDFFTGSLEFTNKTADYVSETRKESQELIAKIGRFYTSHKNASIIITISASYYEGTDTKDAALQRIATIKAALQKSGVPASAIKSTAPTSFASDGELSEDSEEIRTARAYISLTSDKRCTE